MSERRLRRERFFEQHPNCCFCGGFVPATTEDHQPGRIFFKERQWPEGFVFPACENCNAVSRQSERVLGVLIHGEADASDRKRYRANLESVRREFPDAIEALIPTAREVRNIFRDRDLAKPEGMLFGEIPLIKLDKGFWHPHFEMFAQKLLLALHYQCFSVPLSSQGGMWIYIHSNVDFLAGDYPREILEMAEHIALPTRQKRYLGDQFTVRWNFVLDPRTAIFVAQLQRRFVISGITTEAPHEFVKVDNEGTVRPFSHG